jgi:hypothetical protein
LNQRRRALAGRAANHLLPGDPPVAASACGIASTFFLVGFHPLGPLSCLRPIAVVREGRQVIVFAQRQHHRIRPNQKSTDIHRKLLYQQLGLLYHGRLKFHL